MRGLKIAISHHIEHPDLALYLICLLFCYIVMFVFMPHCLCVYPSTLWAFQVLLLAPSTSRQLLYSVLLNSLWKNSCSYLDETLSCCVITTLNFLTDASVIVIYSFALTDSTEQFQAVLYCQLAPRTITVPLV